MAPFLKYNKSFIMPNLLSVNSETLPSLICCPMYIENGNLDIVTVYNKDWLISMADLDLGTTRH